MRLGDLDALYQRVKRSTASKAVKVLAEVLIDTAPTIDAVPVVRCHECVNHRDIDGEHYCKFWWAACPDDSDFFCKAGQRKEADHETVQ